MFDFLKKEEKEEVFKDLKNGQLFEFTNSKYFGHSFLNMKVSDNSFFSFPRKCIYEHVLASEPIKKKYYKAVEVI